MMFGVHRFAIVRALLFVATYSASAQYSYAVSYSGGSCQITNGSPSGPYALSNGGYGGGGTGLTGACSGTVTATFTWTGPAATAPAYAVVTQTCSAGGSAYSGNVTASNGLGDAATNSSSAQPPFMSTSCGYDASGNLIPHYQIKESHASFAVTCTPSVSGSGSPCSVGASYSAHADPIQVTVTGACTDPSDYSLNCLVGQHIVFGVTCGPLVPTSYQWSNIGVEAHWFSYTIYGSIGSSSLGAYYANREVWGPPQGWDALASVQVFFDTSGNGACFTENPMCALVLKDPRTGQSVGNVTATNVLKVWGPYFFVRQDHGASVGYHTDSGGKVDGVQTDNATGISWTGSVGAEALFSLTTGEGYGQWGYTQMINSLLRRRETYSYLWVTPANVSGWLDTSWPYTPYNRSLPTGWPFIETAWQANSTSTHEYTQEAVDAPSFVGISSDIGFDVHDNFYMHVMYQPPAVLTGDGDPAEWIPLVYDNWGWDASPTRSTTASPWPWLTGSTWDHGNTNWPEWTLQWDDVFVSSEN